MKALGAIIAIILCGLPAVLAGAPGLEPGWFGARLAGVPLGVVAMSVLMAVFVALAGWFSAMAARDHLAAERGNR